MSHTVFKWIFHRAWNYMKTASNLFEIIVWDQMPTQQIILWKIINWILISSFFGAEHCDSGLQQMRLTLAENRAYKL